MSDFGRDGIVSDMGSGGSGNAVGKDITSQNVRIDFGDIDPRDLQRIARIVLGDGLSWDGIVQELRKMEQSLTQSMHSMEQRLEERIENIERKIDRRPLMDSPRLTQVLLFAIMAGLFVMTIVVAWGVYVLANGGMG